MISVFFLLKKTLKSTKAKFYKGYFIFFTLVHFCIAFLFAYNLDQLLMIKDPQNFYSTALNSETWLDLFGFGHSFITFIIYPFVKIGVAIESFFVLFALVSYKGFLIYFELLKVNSWHKKRRIILLLFFLIPTIHFWTVFLGKDPLLFLLMALVLKFLHKKMFSKIGLALIFIFIIRPHVGLVLITSFLLLLFINKKIKLQLKIKLVVILVVVTLGVTYTFLKYFLNIETIDSGSLTSFYTKFINFTINHGGNTSINLKETTIFSRWFYLLFMPLPFLYPFKNVFVIATSIENLYFVSIVIYLIVFKIEKLYWNSLNKFTLVTSVLLMLLFASYLYNIGLGNRMRIMFYPYFFYFLNSALILTPRLRINGKN